MNETASSSFNVLFDAFHSISLGSCLIALGALLILIIWETPSIKKSAC